MSRDYRDMKVVIVGAGTTGRGLAAFFLKRGARVILSDSRRREQLPDLVALEQAGAVLDLGGHDPQLFAAAELVVVSPGVPPETPALAEARRRGVPILGEIEIAWRDLDAPMVAITGTNGKSTVTALVGEMFKLWHKEVFVGGNFGTPLIEAVDRAWDWLVVELSSFQLETIRDFRPRYALLLNISEDHLDRYPGMAAYRAAKGRLFENLQEDDVMVLNADDPLVLATAEGVTARRVCFSSTRVLEEGISLVDGRILWRWDENEVIFAAEELRLQGRHNRENVMAAMVPLLLEGCPPEVAWRAARDFSGLPHRMELVAEVGGVKWIDDSKGTNIGSVVKSLAGLARPVTLIAGGKDKQGDLAPLLQPVRERVAHLVLIGEAAQRLAAACAGLTEIHHAADMAAAVRLAATLTPAGGSVLLSPGCSSFDMFKSFEERGQVFAAAVRELRAQGRATHGA